MRIIVFGAGLMGNAIAFDLARSEDIDEIILADIDYNKAQSAAGKIGEKVEPKKVDANFFDDVIEVFWGASVAISALPFSHNYLLTKAALETGVHFLDLGGNNDIVKKQLLLDQRAKELDVCIMPNCGLAPGLVNILAVSGSRIFNTIDEIHLRVGGLPQNPQPPLNYQLVFSAEGLLNEYTEPTEVIRNGDILLVNSLEDVEEIEFPAPFGELEAFNTSGGISTLCHHFQGKVHQLDYKTIRYKGHCEKFKTLIDLGFAGNDTLIFGNSIKTAREFFIDLLEKKLNYKSEDVILLRVTIKGTINGESKTLAYELIDLYDRIENISAMMRTTSFPTSIIAQMLLNGEIKSRGVLPPEYCVPAERLITELRKRNIIITKTIR